MTTLRIGAIEARIVSDGRLLLNPTGMFGQDESQNKEWRREVQLEDGKIPVSINCLLVRVGDRQILLDTGTGRDNAEMIERWGGDCGHLVDNLRAIGVDPGAIDTVILSHAHADHIGGTTRPAGERFVPTFPNARYLFWKTEWDYWTTPESLAERPFLNQKLTPLAEHGRLELAENEIEVAPGVRLLSAPGHTPGHVCVAITSGQETAIYAGDLVHHLSQCNNPEWCPAFDFLPEMSAASRRRILDRAIRDKALLLTAHLPTPGIARATGATWQIGQ